MSRRDVEVDAHIERAARMAQMGREAEAKAYLLHLAVSSLRHARTLKRGPFQDNVFNRQCADATVALGLAYARASRQYRAGRVIPARARLRYWRQVPNPHWPALDSHGVYAQLHDYQGNRGGVAVEVQILPPDYHRSQCCLNRWQPSREQGERYVRRWITIGEAVIAAQVELNWKPIQ